MSHVPDVAIRQSSRLEHRNDDQRQHETSRFERLDGRWYYRDGAVHR